MCWNPGIFSTPIIESHCSIYDCYRGIHVVSCVKLPGTVRSTQTALLQAHGVRLHNSQALQELTNESRIQFRLRHTLRCYGLYTGEEVIQKKVCIDSCTYRQLVAGTRECHKKRCSRFGVMVL